MIQYTAKRVQLDEMRECRGPNCGCYATEGYFVRCRTDRSESVLFVCDDCFNAHYRSRCRIQDFDETEVGSTAARRPRPRVPAAPRRRNVRPHRARTIFSAVAAALLLLTGWLVRDKMKPSFPVDPAPVQKVIRQTEQVGDRFGNLIEYWTEESQ